MKRAACILAALAVLASCDQRSPSAAPSSPSGCSRLVAPAAPADGAPTAILEDLAAGHTEFLIGSPGGPVSRIAEATGASAPRFGGGRVFLSERTGPGAEEVRVAKPGECSTRVAGGSMSEVEPRGRALAVGDKGRWRLVDPGGVDIGEIAGPNGSWTGEGQLVEPTKSFGLVVYDLAGRSREIALPPGSTPIGPLGPDQEIISSSLGFEILDLHDGKAKPFPQANNAQRILGGSPDGNHVALIDAQGVAKAVGIRDGDSLVLPAPGPSLGVLWQNDSQWVAVQSIFGGAVVRLADGKVIDTGPLIVMSW